MARRHKVPRPAEWGKLRQLTLVGQLDALRGMAWAFAVVFHTGLSASAVSKKFTPPEHLVLDADGNPVVSNIMYQYLDGKRPPTVGPRGKLKWDLVGAIDKDPKGRLATPWLNHPIFKVFYPATDLHCVRQILASMPPGIRNYLFRQHEKVDPLYDRLPGFDHDAFVEIFCTGTFEALTAICALCRESQLIGHRLQGEVTLALLRTRAPIFFRLDPVFTHVAWPSFRMIELFYDQKDLRMKEVVSPDDIARIDNRDIGVTSASGDPSPPLKFDFDWYEDLPLSNPFKTN